MLKKLLKLLIKLWKESRSDKKSENFFKDRISEPPNAIKVFSSVYYHFIHFDHYRSNFKMEFA